MTQPPDHPSGIGAERTPDMRTVPVAQVRPARRPAWRWILPLGALGMTLWLLLSAWGGRGVLVQVRVVEGHGIEAGDALIYRGVRVGSVESVELDSDLSGLLLSVRLSPEATPIARAGTRFWIVRPHVSLSGVQGLETIAGARYLAVAPGPPGGERQREFLGLTEPPVLEDLEAAGLEILLEAPDRLGLVAGAPLAYRGVSVGSILSVGLAGDGSSVELRAFVRPPYVDLVRDNTRFWKSGGFSLSLDLDGLRAELDSLHSLVVGGIAFATPDTPGASVRTGHRFRLALRPEDDWLVWRPTIPVGSQSLPRGRERPFPLRAQLTWEEGRFFSRSRGRHGWTLAVPHGLLGPAELLRVPEDASASGVQLELQGESLALSEAPEWVKNGLAFRRLDLPKGTRRTLTPRRRLDTAEDCLVVGDPTQPALALSARRLELQGGSWRVDPALAPGDAWHGGAVLARGDGALVGVLLVEEGRARVAPIPLP